MTIFESLRPVGVMVCTLDFQIGDDGSYPVMVHFHSSCICLDPPTRKKKEKRSVKHLFSLKTSF